MRKILFCFGLGMVGTALGRALIAEGAAVRGTTREAENLDALAALGFTAVRFDGKRYAGDLEAALAGVTHLLASVPPADRVGGDPVLDRFGETISALAPGLVWAGYLSTTGVYGDRRGGRVDEASALRATSDRTRTRVAAEAAWTDRFERFGLPLHIFRLAGIYGPGRNALEAVGSGGARRIVKPGQVFSRIHVDDAVAVLLASMRRPRPGAIYNVCDDEAAPPQDLIDFACDLLGVDAPPLEPFETAEMSPMARGFYADNKRVANDLIKRELGVELTYPSYREGLRALYRGMISARPVA